jgi:hypothetical protein
MIKKIFFPLIAILSIVLQVKAQNGYLLTYKGEHLDTLFQDDDRIEVRFNYPTDLVYKIIEDKALELWQRDSGENNLHIYDFKKNIAYIESPRAKSRIRKLSSSNRVKPEVVFIKLDTTNGYECHQYKVILPKMEISCWVWKDAPVLLPAFILTGEIDLSKIEELRGLFIKVEFVDGQGFWSKYRLTSFEKEMFDKEIFDIPKL